MIPHTTIDRIKAAIDLPALISDYAPLKKSGHQWLTRCIFHDERTASLRVWPDHYYCFGCHAQGSAVDFLMQAEDIAFPEALKRLSERSGVSLDSRPVTRVQLAYAQEEAAFCRWWVEDKKAQILYLANLEMERYDGDLTLCDSLANLSLMIRTSKPGFLFQLFRSLHTSEERKRWAEYMERERRVTEFFQGLWSQVA